MRGTRYTRAFLFRSRQTPLTEYSTPYCSAAYPAMFLRYHTLKSCPLSRGGAVTWSASSCCCSGVKYGWRPVCPSSTNASGPPSFQRWTQLTTTWGVTCTSAAASYVLCPSYNFKIARYRIERRAFFVERYKTSRSAYDR